MEKLRFSLVVFVLVLGSLVGFANYNEDKKDIEPWYKKGTIHGKIFANFHTSGSDVGSLNVFEVQRAYFGYKIDFDDNFAANIKLDIGNPIDFQLNSGENLVVGRRFAFFKNAYLQYKYENLKVQFGIADAFQFKLQEKFWGYRYIIPSFQDINKFGPSADIGIFVSYKFTDWLNVDYSLSNGEGYGNIQDDDNLKNTFGVTLKPIKQVILRAYGDIYSISDSAQTSIALFAGVKFDKFSLGGEYNKQLNNALRVGYDMDGYSFYGTFKFLSKFKAFARYDHLSSSNIEDVDNPGTYLPWNAKRDGDFIIGGVEFMPIKHVNLSLNYRHKLASSEIYSDVASVYMNVQVKF